MSTYFLSDAQLARMRADVARMLPGTATIDAFVTTQNSAGEWSESWTPVTGGTVACRFDPALARDIEMAGGAEAFKSYYQVTLPWDAPISIGNRISFGGVDYEIRQLSNVHSWRVSTRAIVAKVV